MTDLTTLSKLAQRYALSYATPHYFVLSVQGLRSIIQALFPVTNPSDQAQDREVFQKAFDTLGFQWSESNQEKAYLGWKLRAALPETTAPADEPELVHDISPNDLVIETFPERPLTGMIVGMARGVKITHKPTGTVVTCDTERSQHANRDKAWGQLQAALAASRMPALPKPWPGIDTAKLLANAGKPEEIDGAAAAQHERVSELLSWFARLADGHANPKWTREHAFELAFYIATNAMNRQVDLEPVRKAAFAKGVNITDAERALLNRVSPEKFPAKPESEQLHTFLDAAASEGLVLGGIDAADLYIATFPQRYAAAVAAGSKA